ncbi:MAG: hypothetical protein WCF74_03450 [Candidatus Sulfotelmatobacter sp.]
MQATRMVTAPAELTAPDGKGGELGATVAISGSVIVLGAPDTYGGFGTSGTAYLYVEPSGGWTSMQPTADLLVTGYEEYGASVAISGDTVVVGAPLNILLSGFPGAAFVFVKPPGGWATMAPTATLTDSNGSDAFGTTVAIDGDTIVVGAPGSNIGSNTEQGAAYVFVKPSGGWTNMTESAKLTDTDGYTQQLFANTVAISGSTIVAGTGNGDQNSAYVFVEPAGGWIDMTETAELTPSDGVLGDHFGSAVGVRGNTIAVTSPAKEIGSNAGQGAAYVYVKPTGGWTTATQTAELTASNGTTASRLGQSVFVTDNSVLAGAEDVISGHGGVCVFIQPPTGWENMTQNSELVYPAAGGEAAWFGSSVAQSGRNIVIGAPALGTNAPGAAYVFTQ